MSFLVSELSEAVSDTHGGIVPAGVRTKRFRGDDIEIKDVSVKHFRQRRHVSETASLNSDTREKLWFTNVKPDNSLVPAGRNVYSKRYPPSTIGSPIPHSTGVPVGRLGRYEILS
jgi:hypothetical protein